MFEWINPFKTEKKLLTQKAKRGVDFGVIPTLIQFVILVLVIFEFKFLLGQRNGTKLISSPVDVGGEITNPNIVRLIYLFVSLAGAFVLAFFANKTSKDDSKTLLSFWLGVIGGILLWQSIGECSWHFGFSIDGAYIGFPKIEGASGTFILALAVPLLIYAQGKHAFSWGVGIFILSFMCNWIGHWVLEGTYPWFAALVSEKTWLKISGLIFGISLTLVSLYMMFFASKNKKAVLITSLLLYTGLGIIASGVVGL